MWESMSSNNNMWELSSLSLWDMESSDCFSNGVDSDMSTSTTSPVLARCISQELNSLPLNENEHGFFMASSTKTLPQQRKTTSDFNLHISPPQNLEQNHNRAFKETHLKENKSSRGDP